MSTNYKLESIILIESHFKREPKISYESEQFKSDLNVATGYQKENNKLLVILEIDFIAGIEDKKEIDISTKMLGTFVIPNNITDKLLERFAKINAPAIIFPFIREHIANLSLKAGLHPILLPPINFVKLAQDNNKE